MQEERISPQNDTTNHIGYFTSFGQSMPPKPATLKLLLTKLENFGDWKLVSGKGTTTIEKIVPADGSSYNNVISPGTPFGFLFGEPRVPFNGSFIYMPSENTYVSGTWVPQTGGRRSRKNRKNRRQLKNRQQRKSRRN